PLTRRTVALWPPLRSLRAPAPPLAFGPGGAGQAARQGPAPAPQSVTIPRHLPAGPARRASGGGSGSGVEASRPPTTQAVTLTCTRNDDVQDRFFRYHSLPPLTGHVGQLLQRLHRARLDSPNDATGP